MEPHSLLSCLAVGDRNCKSFFQVSFLELGEQEEFS